MIDDILSNRIISYAISYQKPIPVIFENPATLEKFSIFWYFAQTTSMVSYFQK